MGSHRACERSGPPGADAILTALSVQNTITCCNDCDTSLGDLGGELRDAGDRVDGAVMADEGLMGATVRVADDVLCRILEGEAVILDLGHGTYFGLDPTGTRIWQLIDEQAGRVKEMHASLVREYDVGPDQCERDLLRLLEEMRAKGLIVVVDGQAR